MNLKRTILVTLLCLAASGAYGDLVTNFWSTFTAAAPETGTLSNLQKASADNGYLSLGSKGNAAASATVDLVTAAGFGQSVSFSSNVVLTLDWVQILPYQTTLSAFNSNGDILFELAADVSGSLLWDGVQVPGASVNASSALIELNLKADNTVDLVVDSILYGTSLPFNNTFARDLANLTFSRPKHKNETARFDNIRTLTDTQPAVIPEPGVVSLFVLSGMGLLIGRRFLQR
jgi:hypothetical protein